MANEMTNEEAIAIIRKEYLCVDRDCDIERSCGKCDLAMPSKEPILEAFKMAMQALETIPKYKDAYNKGWDDGAKASYEHLKMCEEEQEPCEDAISRQIISDYVESHIQEINTGYGDLNKHTNEILRMIVDYIESMPPINPQEPKADVLDKIRAEIEKVFCISIVTNELRTPMEVKTEILQIIDKYKAESEGK